MNLLAILFIVPFQAAQPADTAKIYEIPTVTVHAPLKHNGVFSEQPVAVTSLTMENMEFNRIGEPKNLSLTVPNLLFADYGSKMTGSIYIRGIGARMDQPAMGLYVDNIPVLNKNNYDFDYFDVRSMDVLRGPQGTLYGRNTIGGVIEVHTLSPFDYQGTRINAEYGNGNTSKARISTYHRPADDFAFSIALNHHYNDGFFTNEYDDSPADRILSESGRLKIQAKLSPQWIMENVFYANYVKQKGFAYSLYEEDTDHSINHNDPCSYDRFNLTNGLTFRYKDDKIRFSSTTSFQYTDDDMTLDQDFRPVSMFTLRQRQQENAMTQEVILRPTEEKAWQWISGAFGFYRNIELDAPVTFKYDGIDELILANANAGIHTVFPKANLQIREEQFPIESHFKLPAFGMSLYHQSDRKVGRWKFLAGIRFDYERTAIRYANSANIHYRFTLTMPEYKLLPVEMDGRQSKAFFEVMPKVAVMYATGAGNLYLTVAQGYKTGGYNTQIFSDLLQNRLMSRMMSDLGVYFSGYETGYDVESAISYKPEYSWNYEAGGHFRLFNGKLFVDAALFYMDCRNQQLTVFPPGKTTGRLMSNAGRTRSFGAELSADYRYGNLHLTGNYGHTNAKFIVFDNGNDNYSGKRIPYAPINTVSANCEYRLDVSHRWIDHLLFNIGWQGVGKIYWNEDNTISQPFYSFPNAYVALKKNAVVMGLWGKNLTETEYATFYFKSVGNSFIQRGKPLQMGVFLTINL